MTSLSVGFSVTFLNSVWKRRLPSTALSKRVARVGGAAAAGQVLDRAIAGIGDDGGRFRRAKFAAQPLNVRGKCANRSPATSPASGFAGFFGAGSAFQRWRSQWTRNLSVRVALQRAPERVQVLRAQALLLGPRLDGGILLSRRPMLIQPQRGQAFFVIDRVLLVEVDDRLLAVLLPIGEGDDGMRGEPNARGREQRVIGDKLGGGVILLEQGRRHGERFAGVVEALAGGRVNGE